MALSWNEIKDRALNFSLEFKDAHYEKGETQTFYNEFFNVFGVNRRRVATFEEPVKKLGDKRGFIDLFWKGVLLVEQKSEGRDLKKAKEQALDYFPNLKDDELPRYIMVSDFQTFELYDLETGEEKTVSVEEVKENGYTLSVSTYIYNEPEREEIDPIQIKADADNAFLQHIRATLDFEKAIAEMEGRSILPLLTSIKAVLAEYES